MKKVLVIVISFISIISVKAIDINSKSGIVYNLNDDIIIYEKDINDKLPIASLTKIMTAIIVIENTNLDDNVKINYQAFNGLDGYALAGFKAGDKVTIRDLLYGLMLPSGAECGNVLAMTVSDSYDEFVDLMNSKVAELQLENTHFDNVIGMDSNNNYSTSYDLSIILKYALNNEIFKSIFTSTSYTTTNGLKFNRTIDKYGKGMDLSLIKGDKTGHTDEAGYCLASISNIDDIDYLIITLGANNTKDFINDHNNLYNYFKDNYSYRYILNKDKLLISIPVKDAKIKTYDVISNKEIKKYLSNDINLDDIEYDYNGIDIITKKIKTNDKLGTISIKYNNEILDTYDVYLNTDIKYNIHWFKYVLIISLIISYIFIINTSRTFNNIDAIKIFIYGIILCMILYYFFYMLDAYIVLEPIKRYKDRQNKKQIEFWNKTKIDKKSFFNNFNYEVRKYYYSKEDIIDFDVLDYIEFNELIKDNIQYIKVCAEVRLVYYNNGKIKSKYTKEEYLFKKNYNGKLELNNGVNMIKCHNCGSNIDATKGYCSYCHAEIKYLQDWILVSNNK